MASGYTSAVTNGSFSIRFYWVSSYNAATNKSTVTVTPQVRNTGNYGGDLRACGYNLSNAGIYLNGALNYAFDSTWGTSNNLVCSANVDTWTNFPPYAGSLGTMSITHNANGVATATVRFLGTVVPLNATSYRKGIDTGNQTITITENAASSIASASSSVTTQGSYSLTMSRKNTSNYHIATFKYNNQTTLYTSGRFDTSLSLSVPRSWFADYPSAASLPVTVSVQTYNSGGTAVGAALTHSLTVAADADMKPVVSAGWAALAVCNTGAVSGMSGYVKGYSRAQAAFDLTKIDMSGAVGASVASCSVSCQGETVSSAPYLTPVLASEAVAVTCTVTDSRGRTASETFSLAVMDYAAPSMTGQAVFRCDASGAADEDGTCLSVRATAVYSSLNGSNICTLTAAYKSAGGAYGAETSLSSGTASVLGPVSADASYTVRITATDALGNSAVYYAVVPTRKWAMKFRPNGRGAAFGKAAETDDLFEITGDWDVKIGGDLTVLGSIIGGGGGISFDDVYPVGSIYMSVNSTDPGTLFGGTWERIRDRFLLAAGTTYAAGDTGGEAAHTLTDGELPKTSGEWWMRRMSWGTGSSQSSAVFGGASGIASSAAGSGGADSVAYYSGVSRTPDRIKLAFGNDEAHNNMPPYLAVDIWKRTA